MVIEFLDIDTERPATLPPTIVMAVVFLMKKLLECLRVMEDVDIGIFMPDDLPMTILEFIIVVTMIEVYISLKRLSTLPLSIVEFIIVVIKVVMMAEVDISLKRSTTPTLAIVEQELMLKVDVNIGLRKYTLPPITQVVMTNFRVYNFLLALLTKMFINMRE